MTSFGHWPLQQAMYAALIADTALMDTVSAVYDFVPQDAVYPYLTLGDAVGTDASNLAAPGMRFECTLAAYSQHGGRKEAAAILDRVYAVLREAQLHVSGMTLVFIRALDSAITLQPDGVTYKGVLRIRAEVRG